MRWRLTSAAKFAPVSNFGFRGSRRVGAHSEQVLSREITREAHDLAKGSCSMTTKQVAVDSTARLRRYHDASGIFCPRCGRTSDRSRATTPNPPAFIIQSAACNALSTGVSFRCGAAHLTHNTLLRVTPLAAAERGSNALLASISAQ